MNASPISTSSPVPPAAIAEGPSSRTMGGRKARRSLKYSITGICFIFGGLLALGMRAMQRVNEEEARSAQGVEAARQQAQALTAKVQNAEAANTKMKGEMAILQSNLRDKGKLSGKQIQALNSRIKELQTLAGMTPVTGPGIRITLQDNPEVAKANEGGALPGMPGIVHDFDVLQVVNELRAAGADAIAVKGVRITGYTPIRCVGPAIMINGRPVQPPYTVEAIGNSRDLHTALAMPSGIVDNLKGNGGIQVAITDLKKIKLPEASDQPSLRVGVAG